MEGWQSSAGVQIGVIWVPSRPLVQRPHRIHHPGNGAQRSGG